jgi:hypothetical protein
MAAARSCHCQIRRRWRLSSSGAVLSPRISHRSSQVPASDMSTATAVYALQSPRLRIVFRSSSQAQEGVPVVFAEKGLPVVSSEKTTIHRICAGHQAWRLGTGEFCVSVAAVTEDAVCLRIDVPGHVHARGPLRPVCPAQTVSKGIDNGVTGTIPRTSRHRLDTQQRPLTSTDAVNRCFFAAYYRRPRSVRRTDHAIR